MNQLFSFPRRQALKAVAIGISVPAQSRAQQPPAPGALWSENLDLSGLTRTLQTFKPAITPDKIRPSNDVLLEFRPIAIAGVNRIKIVSGMPRTDAIWLLTLSPYPDAGNPLLASANFDVSTLPEVSFSPKLYHTQRLLAIVRSAGQYYGVHREIKIAKASGKTPR